MPEAYVPATTPEHPCVLLVEDDEDNRDMYRTALESQGFAVVAAGDGLTAFQQAFQKHPDVVVTDLAIPGIDGFELCRRLRATGRTREIPIISLTGRFTTKEDRARPGADCFDLFLLKPCDPITLLSEIRRILAQSHALRARSSDARDRAHEASGRAVRATVRSREVRDRWRSVTSREEARRRIRADFREMPGLRITVQQGARLWNLDTETCGRVLDELVAEGVLVRTAERYHV